MSEVLTLSFEDCPYECIDGKLFNPGLKRMEDCPYCKEKREKLIKQGVVKEENSIDLYKELNIPEYFRGIEYSFETVLPNKNRLTEESIKDMESELETTYNKLNIKELLDYSVLFNLGMQGNIFAFVYPYILRAYKVGFSVTPLISNIDIMEHINKLEKGESSKYIDWVNCDVSVITMQAGITEKGVGIIRGYMQERAKRGKSTIIFTNAKIDYNIKQLLCNLDDNKNLYLANYISVHYQYDNETKEESSEEPINNGKQVITMEQLMKQNC